uniref:Uncharacterized protein n=1 Tax=Romanomermis culicivorax TaxID=13658 RepID=A0A915IXX3_ROMCU
MGIPKTPVCEIALFHGRLRPKYELDSLQYSIIKSTILYFASKYYILEFHPCTNSSTEVNSIPRAID